jgi:hypothetical protein
MFIRLFLMELAAKWVVDSNAWRQYTQQGDRRQRAKAAQPFEAKGKA